MTAITFTDLGNAVAVLCIAAFAFIVWRNVRKQDKRRDQRELRRSVERQQRAESWDMDHWPPRRRGYCEHCPTRGHCCVCGQGDAA